MLIFEILLSFVAEKHDVGYVPGGQISFDAKPVDNGNNFDIMEGKLVVPTDGYYCFLFNGYVNPNDHVSRIEVLVNGEPQRTFFDSNSNEVTFHFTLELKRNDELWLENRDSSAYYTNSEYVMTFMGYLIN